MLLMQASPCPQYATYNFSRCITIHSSPILTSPNPLVMSTCFLLWHPVAFPKINSSCYCETIRGLFENSLASSIKFTIDIIDIYPNLLIAIIGTPILIAIIGTNLVNLRKSYPNTIVWFSNRDIVKSKMLNQSTTLKYVE